MRTSRLLAVCIFILLGCGTALAQTATVSGAVRDQTGGALPGVTVELTAGRGAPLVAATDASGRYPFERVPPGTYNPRPDIFNLFDEAVSDIDYYFASRLPGEPLEGVSDIHFHPAVPRTVRISLVVGF
jgi:protocatechuate 3,4-dioxygenase beta subunit